MLHDIAYEHPELRVSLRHALRCQSILQTMEEENSNDATVTSSDVIDVLAETLLVRFLSKDVAAKFYEAVENFNTSFNNTKKNIGNDGDDNRENITKFINNEFFAQDSRAFRTHYVDSMPDLSFDIDYVCPVCTTQTEMTLPIQTNFFWPSR